MAIPVDIACSLEMRVVSIQSEAGGRLGRCNLHNSLRRQLAKFGTIWRDISYDLFAYSLAEGDAKPNGNLDGHRLCSRDARGLDLQRSGRPVGAV